MDLEGVMLCDVSSPEKEKCHMISLIHGIYEQMNKGRRDTKKKKWLLSMENWWSPEVDGRWVKWDKNISIMVSTE